MNSPTPEPIATLQPTATLSFGSAIIEQFNCWGSDRGDAHQLLDLLEDVLECHLTTAD
jgi:hypothetical protein